MMDLQSTINKLKDILYTGFSDYLPEGKKRNDAIRVAIETLEKQRPRKIIEDGAYGKCPACKAEFNSELRYEYTIKHCHKCGQKIDWEGE